MLSNISTRSTRKRSCTSSLRKAASMADLELLEVYTLDMEEAMLVAATMGITTIIIAMAADLDLEAVGWTGIATRRK
jgi:hypothetical protein